MAHDLQCVRGANLLVPGQNTSAAIQSLDELDCNDGLIELGVELSIHIIIADPVT